MMPEAPIGALRSSWGPSSRCGARNAGAAASARPARTPRSWRPDSGFRPVTGGCFCGPGGRVAHQHPDPHGTIGSRAQLHRGRGVVGVGGPHPIQRGRRDVTRGHPVRRHPPAGVAQPAPAWPRSIWPSPAASTASMSASSSPSTTRAGKVARGQLRGQPMSTRAQRGGHRIAAHHRRDVVACRFIRSTHTVRRRPTAPWSPTMPE